MKWGEWLMIVLALAVAQVIVVPLISTLYSSLTGAKTS
jgi:hypothetical protein